MKYSFNPKKIIGLAAAGLFSVPAMAAENAEAASQNIWDTPINEILIMIAVILFIVILLLGYMVNKVASTKELWISKKTLGILLVVFLSSYSLPVSATEVVATAEESGVNEATYILIAINVIFLAIAIYLKHLVGQILFLATGIEAKSVNYIPSAEYLTAYVPVEREHEIMTDHEYDGIRELDNDLPPWWKGLFYAGILFGLIYFPYYHFTSAGLLQEEEYIVEMEEAAIAKEKYLALVGGMVDETNVKVLTSESALENGAKIFELNCIACHGGAGEGGIGPNLTDEYWLHGGDVKGIFKTIKYGVKAKGMIPWEDKLSPANIAELSSYILSLKGTNPANGKAPQGELFAPAIADSTVAQ